MRAKLSIELETDELEELESIMRKCSSTEDEVTIRLSSDTRQLARSVNRVIEGPKNFCADDGY